MESLSRCKRRCRPSQSGSESSTSSPSDSEKSDSSDSSDSRDDETEEEEEEEEDEEEMEYLALDYSQEDSGDDSDAYAPQSPLTAHHQSCSFL